MQTFIDNQNKIVYMPDDLNEDIYQAIHDDSGVDSYYEYFRKKGKFKKISKFISAFLGKIIFLTWNRLDLGIKVYGRKNLKALKKGGITVSNHVHYVDFTFSKYFMKKHKKIYTVTLAENFRIPFVKTLASAYGCIPLAEKPENHKLFIKRINEVLLNENAVVHIFPEASLWPYYNKLRPFKEGASHFAVKANKPIVPSLITFREVTGLRKLIRKRPLVNLYILNPEYPNLKLPIKERTKELNERIYNKMQDKLNEVQSYEYYKYVKKSQAK